MNKNHLTVLMILIPFFMVGQKRIATFYLKSDTVLKNAKFKRKGGGFKVFKEKPQNHEFIKSTEIDSMTYYEFGKMITAVNLPVKDKEGSILVERLVHSEKVQLYCQHRLSNQIGETYKHYYVRRDTAEPLTDWGPYSTLRNNLRKKIMDYFADCELVVQKMKDGELRVRNGAEPIAEFYAANCE